MALNQEIIELLIEAKNLSDDELKKAAVAVEKLGNAADKTEKELDQLTIDRENLERFIELRTTIKELNVETAKAESRNERYTKSVKKAGDETEKQRIKIINNRKELSAQNATLKRQQKEYEVLEKTLKKAGVSTRTFNVSLDKNAQAIKSSELRLIEINKAYVKQVSSLKKSTQEETKAQNVRRASIDLLQLEANEIDVIVTAQIQAIKINERLTASARAKASVDKSSAEASRKKAIEDEKVIAINRRLIENQKKKIQLDKELALEQKKQATEQKKLNKLHAQAIAINNKLNREKREQADLDEKTAIEARRVVRALKEYEVALKKLNRQLERGKISKAKFIEGEKRLRQQLRLTEKQVKRTNAVLAGQSFTKSIRNTDALTKVTRRLAQAYTVVIAAQKAAAVVGASVKGFSDLEAAVTKVEKTTNLTKEQLIAMTDQLQLMATEITPTATNELLRFAEVAGQLGADGTEDLLNIASAADALAVSTNLSGEEAVTLLARMLKMTGEGIPAIQNLSSSLVELGNNFAANEAEIAQMTKEVITGTRAIDLGSAAAAGFGATLKELGQTGERSRSTLTRLSNVIKVAAVEGGDDLKNLSAITQLTGNQIRESLGEDSEKILLAFIDGLARVKEEGGIVSKTLDQFNITSIESKTVLGALASNTERLHEAVRLSSEAYIVGNVHLQEAAKAYATQESSLGRLNNKFIELTARVGEAFSDETATTVDALTGVMDEQSSTVIELAQNFADVTQELFSLFEAFEALLDTVGIIDAIGGAFNVLRIGVNTISLAFRSMIEVVLSVRIKFLEFKESIGILSEEGQRDLNELRQTQEENFIKMGESIDGLSKSIRIANGETTASYEDLKESVIKYSDSLDLLTESERKEIDSAIKSGDAQKLSQGRLIELTSAVVKANREKQIRIKLLKQQEEREFKISESTKELVGFTKQLSQARNGSAEQTELIAKETKKLQENLDKGVISLEQFKASMGNLSRATLNTAAELIPFVKSTEELSDAQNDAAKSSQDLVGSIITLQRSIVDYEKDILNLEAGTRDYEDATRGLALAQIELAKKQKELGIIRELEKKTLNELIIIQSAHTLEVEKVEAAYLAGTLSQDAYRIKSEELAITTNFLNDAIGSNTSAIQNNIEVLNAANDALQERIVLMRESLGLEEDNTEETGKGAGVALELESAVSLWLIAQNRLNKELNFTDLTIGELTEKSAELETEWRHLVITTGGWFDDLVRLNNQAVRREQQVIKETIALKRLEAQVASGALTTQQLEKAASRAVFSFKALGDEQLAPLRAAIKEAQAEFQDLSDTINDSFADVEDRLDAILGNEQAIVKRKFQRELEELADLLDAAEESGDNRLINKINEAIRNLKKAQDLEFKDQFGTNNTRTNNQQTDNTQQTGIGTSSGQTVTVNLNLNGVNTTFDFANQNSADSFIASMEALGEVNSQGIG